MHVLAPFFFLLSTLSLVAVAKTPEHIIKQHLTQYSEMEHFSAIQVSIKARNKIENYAVGKVSRDSGSANITPDNLFSVGSITKSYTAVLALLAEKDKQLQLDKPLKNYLKDYPHWGSFSLTRLLNMSTGIPNYSNSPTMNYWMSKDLKKFWSSSELLSLVYPKKYNPPMKSGYFYSNTGYVLMDEILSQQTHLPFVELLQSKIIQPLKLHNTFYPLPTYPKEVLQRMARGYSFNIYDNPELLGQDVSDNNLSWGGAAGAIVANSEDVVRWVEALFINPTFLNAAQKSQMQQLISVAIGKPLYKTNADDPRGFGLGIIQAYDKDIGHYWFYEGETLGYRGLYMYVPSTQIIIVALLNSATNEENDHAGELVKKLYEQTLKNTRSVIT